MRSILHKKESFKIIGICMEIHNQLGPWFLEIVYKDALEFELNNAGIPYQREKEYSVEYKGHHLAHKFYADFVIYDKIILKVKASSGLDEIPRCNAM
jgi:GxxExxY protein